MGLDFTNIKDGEGAALYILHTGGMTELAKLERLVEQVKKLTKHQCLLIDVNSREGERIRDFYDILPEKIPAAIIIRDDDSISQTWYASEIPTADVISYALRQISGS